MVAGRRPAPIERVAGDIAGLAVAADVCREDDVAALIADCEEAFGRLDVLVNNAGVVPPRAGVEDQDMAHWDATFAVNVRGVVLAIKHAAPMLKRRGGAIVNMASRVALHGYPRQIAYSAQQVRGPRDHSGGGAGTRPLRHPRQRTLPQRHPDQGTTPAPHREGRRPGTHRRRADRVRDSVGRRAAPGGDAQRTWRRRLYFSPAMRPAPSPASTWLSTPAGPEALRRAARSIWSTAEQPEEGTWWDNWTARSRW